MTIAMSVRHRPDCLSIVMLAAHSLFLKHSEKGLRSSIDGRPANNRADSLITMRHTIINPATADNFNLRQHRESASGWTQAVSQRLKTKSPFLQEGRPRHSTKTIFAEAHAQVLSLVKERENRRSATLGVDNEIHSIRVYIPIIDVPTDGLCCANALWIKRRILLEIIDNGTERVNQTRGRTQSAQDLENVLNRVFESISRGMRSVNLIAHICSGSRRSLHGLQRHRHSDTLCNRLKEMLSQHHSAALLLQDRRGA